MARSRLSPWLTAEAVRLSLSADRPTWRSSITVSNSTRRLRSVRDRSIWFSISVKSYHWIHHAESSHIRVARSGYPQTKEICDVQTTLENHTRDVGNQWPLQ